MADNEWTQPDAPPPPLFLGEKERDFVKQVNDELIERVIGQGIFYYPISIEHTNYHPLYGEAIEKTFTPNKSLCVTRKVLTETTNLGIDRRPSIVVHFTKEDNRNQNLSEKEILSNMVILFMR